MPQFALSICCVESVEDLIENSTILQTPKQFVAWVKEFSSQSLEGVAGVQEPNWNSPIVGLFRKRKPGFQRIPQLPFLL